MLIRNPWPSAAAKLAGILFVALIVGVVSGRVLLCLLLTVAGVFALHVIQLYRLERWLREGRRLRPPEAGGLWGTVFDNLFRLQRRHRQRRQRLAELLNRFRATANAMPDATVILNVAGEMQWWNAKATRYFGLRAPQDEGQRIVNLVRHPSFNEFMDRGDWREAVKVTSPVEDTRVLEIRIVPYGIDQRLLVARDITRLHRLETMRRDFVANITHELRTPLTVLRGLAETLGDYAPESSEALARPLSLMEQQTLRMGRLVDDLLLLSRLETSEASVEREPVQVAAMLEELAGEARTVSGGDHEIVLDVDEELVIEGSGKELRSAFSNLVVNAVKYTPAGGRITIRWAVDRGEAAMSVTDSGQGIPAHHIPRLTERFYRVDSGRAAGKGGTGLGLAIVKHVLSRHGATLRIESTMGEGSRFTCGFPEYQRQGVAWRVGGGGRGLG